MRHRALVGTTAAGVFASIIALAWLLSPRTPQVHATDAVAARPQPASTAARVTFESSLDALANQLDSLDETLNSALADAAAAGKRDQNAERTASRNAMHAIAEVRTRYKRLEALITYFAPGSAATLNGPAESDDPDMPPPPLGAHSGFESIGDALDQHDVKGALAQTKALSVVVRSIRGATKFLDVSDTATLDAARLELARVMTTGVAGFDASRTDSAIAESATAIEGVRATVSTLKARGAKFDQLETAALASLDSAAAFLRTNPRFDRLDRLAFTSHYAIPAAHAVLALRQMIDSATPAARRLWRPSTASPFDVNAFDPSALSPEYAPRTSPELIEAGHKLFFDPRLSGPGTRSCASCHQPAKAFADGRVTAAPIDVGAPHGSVAATAGGRPAPRLRNTPTLINAALQQTMFADERAGFVEDQIRVVLSSATEMASSPEIAGKRVGMGERDVRVALAAYIRSLIALDSRFDRAVRGDSSAMNASERNGYTVFMGKGKCGTCHFAPLFGGTMPPEFTHSELEIVGAPRSAVTTHARIDPDSGRATVDNALAHRFAFRVPSLRNVAVTAPYMHNGVYRTLEQVIDFYDRGGGAGIGVTLPSQTLDSAPLHLTVQEKRDLAAFLGALTDTSQSVAKP